jgi:CMP-N-acetylneuraminic acid synthetase
MMQRDKTFLAVIPARGGSKRLPQKNIIDLAGRPLIAWTIEAALKCKSLNEVIVSTDDQEIAEVARNCGAPVPFLRPAELATDEASTFMVIKHALDFLLARGRSFDFVVLLQPTSPLRSSRHIDDAISLLREKNADAIISVSEMHHSPNWANTLPVDGSMSNFFREEIKNVPGQTLETYFRLNGAIYVCSIERLLEEQTLFLRESIYAYRMDRKCSVDIDDKIDFLVADALMRERVGRT